jgi:Uma2 family endonuclease
MHARALPHLRPLKPLHFPTEAEVPETKVHLTLRTALYAILKLAFGDSACVGSDQFVYWNARDPKRCAAPDVFVRKGERDTLFKSWKTWERGTPELAVEILSEDEDWDDKLARYHELGVKELVAFDPEALRIRVWDRLEDDLVERKVDAKPTPCVTLGGSWVVAPIEGLEGLRLARDERGKDLLPTPTEKKDERIAELEAALGRRKKPKRRAPRRR